MSESQVTMAIAVVRHRLAQSPASGTELRQLCGKQGIGLSAVHAARKEIGAKAEFIDGTWYHYLPAIHHSLDPWKPPDWVGRECEGCGKGFLGAADFCRACETRANLIVVQDIALSYLAGEPWKAIAADTGLRVPVAESRLARVRRSGAILPKRVSARTRYGWRWVGTFPDEKAWPYVGLPPSVETKGEALRSWIIGDNGMTHADTERTNKTKETA